jgi:hypothetical protein
MNDERKYRYYFRLTRDLCDLGLSVILKEIVTLPTNMVEYLSI